MIFGHRHWRALGTQHAQVHSALDSLWVEALDRFARRIEQGDSPGTLDLSRWTARVVAEGETTLSTIDLPADPSRVFRALTTREIERWWGAADGYCVRRWTSELRVGGEWSLDVTLPDGARFPFRSEYLAIESPRRIVFSLRCECDDHGWCNWETTVTYRLGPVAGGTRLSVSHCEHEGNDDLAVGHADGWVPFLNRLGAYLAAEMV